MDTNTRKKATSLALASVPNEEDFEERAKLTVNEMRREMVALNAALVAVEYNRGEERVLPLVLDAISVRSNTNDAEDVAILSAMSVIAGNEVPPIIEHDEEWAER